MKIKKGILSVIIALLVLLIGGSLMYTGVIWPNAWFVGDYQVRGIDVSNHQKEIDWQQVAKAGYTFAFIKASEGTTFKDNYFQANWQGAKANGLLRGAYHFYSEDLPGLAQANHFISIVPREAGMLPPVLDLEVHGQDRQAMLRELRTFLTRLEQYYGVKPIIYTDHERYNEYVKRNFEDYPLWFNDTLWPIQWDNIKGWTFWQYCSRGHVAGIEEYTDLNVFSAGKEKLKQMSLAD